MDSIKVVIIIKFSFFWLFVYFLLFSGFFFLRLLLCFCGSLCFFFGSSFLLDSLQTHVQECTEERLRIRSVDVSIVQCINESKRYNLCKDKLLIEIERRKRKTGVERAIETQNVAKCRRRSWNQLDFHGTGESGIGCGILAGGGKMK